SAKGVLLLPILPRARISSRVVRALSRDPDPLAPACLDFFPVDFIAASSRIIAPRRIFEAPRQICHPACPDKGRDRGDFRRRGPTCWHARTCSCRAFNVAHLFGGQALGFFFCGWRTPCQANPLVDFRGATIPHIFQSVGKPKGT